MVLLFERGAFDASSTAAVAWALLFYAPGLVGHAVVEIAARAFYALRDTMTPVLVGSGAMVVNIVLSLFLMPRFGSPSDLSRGAHGALALANTVATTLEMVMLLWLLHHRLRALLTPGLVRSVVRLGGATAVMGGVLLAGSHLTTVQSWPAPAQGIIGVLLGAGLYAGAAWLFRAEELHMAYRLFVDRRLRTPGPGG
ncbi:MAG: lipid II flippase MurJ [Ardenticatenia bacterium]|nr:lipid II flippase MurJ [Ardenticatenia bacterium]